MSMLNAFMASKIQLYVYPITSPSAFPFQNDLPALVTYSTPKPE